MDQHCRLYILYHTLVESTKHSRARSGYLSVIIKLNQGLGLTTYKEWVIGFHSYHQAQPYPTSHSCTSLNVTTQAFIHNLCCTCMLSYGSERSVLNFLHILTQIFARKCERLLKQMCVSHIEIYQEFRNVAALLTIFWDVGG